MAPDKAPVDSKDAGAGLTMTSVQNRFDRLVSSFFKPVAPYSLGVVRSLFGLMMVIDIPDERGLHIIEKRFGDPMTCHFPLFHWWTPLPFEYMGLLYFIMWLGAVGICIGLLFRTSCIMFVVPYWYIFLLNKTTWNNHSYLYGLVSTLFLFTEANNYFSVDSIIQPSIRNKPVPVWNYWIIRFQFFLLYFYAGLKKFDADWLGGYSMTALGNHWVFDPFRLLLTTEQIDLWIIHIFGFLFDLTVGFFLLCDKTRSLAIFFSAHFHLMNSRMFDIGQFPYVCLVTTPIFCNYAWPLKIKDLFGKSFSGHCQSIEESDAAKYDQPSRKQKIIFSLVTCYVALQLFLPYSHSLTPGYNNWTNGLYGYSWDMMVHSWDTTLVTITVKDKTTGRTHYLDPQAWVLNTRYSKHADTAVQYAACVKRNLATLAKNQERNELQDIFVYMDVWCSLNNRFQQRMIDPNQDLITADWSPFSKTPWLLPLLTDLTPWREHLSALKSEVYHWSNSTDVLFVADFPGMSLEHFVRKELQNVTLTVLQGSVVVDRGDKTKASLTKGDRIRVKTGKFHNVFTSAAEPSCIMYTYNNASYVPEAVAVHTQGNLFHDFNVRYQKLLLSLWNLRECYFKVAANFGLIESF